MIRLTLALAALLWRRRVRTRLRERGARTAARPHARASRGEHDDGGHHHGYPVGHVGPERVQRRSLRRTFRSGVLRWPKAQTGGGGGGMARETPLDKKFRAVDERSADITRRMSQEQASRLVKAAYAAGMNADADDPCARVMAMYDSVSDELQLEPEVRAEALRRCQSMPASHLACLKPERERSPFERRMCRRFLRDTDTPDVFGENGSIMQRLPEGVQEGPQRVEGPVAQE